MSEFSVSLAKLAEEANLTIAYTPCELDKIQVTATEVYRPGILLAGYYENFDNKRVQIIGLTEMSYLEELSTSLRNTHLEKLFSFQPPAVILTRGMQPLSEMMQFAKQYGVPLLMSTEMTSALMGMLITTLNKELANVKDEDQRLEYTNLIQTKENSLKKSQYNLKKQNVTIEFQRRGRDGHPA